MTNQERASLIWSIADLLRGDYRQTEYGKVVLVFVVLRRMDCVLKATKAEVLATKAQFEGTVTDLDKILNHVAKQDFHNSCNLDMESMLAAPSDLSANLIAYVDGFSANAREVLSKFALRDQIKRLDEKNLLYHVMQKFVAIDLGPMAVPTVDMGEIFEELIWRFSAFNEAGEHYTPPEIVHLMLRLLTDPDKEALTSPGVARTIYDPTCGTGRMLSESRKHVNRLNPESTLEIFGQELNEESYAIGKSDMFIKGYDPSQIAEGNTLTEDGHKGKRFDYIIANPPFGVDWKKYATPIQDEHRSMGDAGRFGAGLPRTSDGSFLFLQHMIAKMKPVEEGGSRIAIILSGSPLFSGAAGSGESEIRRWIIENDWLEAIVALPQNIFYNTGIGTYVWIVTNRKPSHRKGKVQLINAVNHYEKMRKSKGEKRYEIADSQIEDIARMYHAFEDELNSKVLANLGFGYRRITVDRPMLDEKGNRKTDKEGNIVADAGLRDYENVPLTDDVNAYFKRDVLPFAPDAWVDHDKTKIGYEIPFTRYFYEYKAPRPVSEVESELRTLNTDIRALLGEVLG